MISTLPRTAFHLLAVACLSALPPAVFAQARPYWILPSGMNSSFCGEHQAQWSRPANWSPEDLAQSTARTAAQAHTTVSYRRVTADVRYISGDAPRYQVAADGFCLRSGLRLTSRDPAIHAIAWFDGGLSSGLLRNGEALVLFPSLFSRDPPPEVRVAAVAEQAGQEIRRPGGSRAAPSHPEIPGYRYVASDFLFTDHYLGLWRRLGGTDETLIVMFSTSEHGNPVRQGVIGRLPLRIGSLITNSAIHGGAWEVTLTSEAPIGRPVYLLHYFWAPLEFEPLPARPTISRSGR